jgi:hypothetical protein
MVQLFETLLQIASTMVLFIATLPKNTLTSTDSSSPSAGFSLAPAAITPFRPNAPLPWWISHRPRKYATVPMPGYKTAARHKRRFPRNAVTPNSFWYPCARSYEPLPTARHRPRRDLRNDRSTGRTARACPSGGRMRGHGQRAVERFAPKHAASRPLRVDHSPCHRQRPRPHRSAARRRRYAPRPRNQLLSPLRFAVCLLLGRKSP